MITPYSNTIQVTTEKFPFEFTINTANTSSGSSAADQFRLPLVSSLPLNAVVDWGDGSSDTITVFNQPEVTHTYNTTTTTEFTISITGDLSGWQFASSGDRLKILEITSWESLTISVDTGFRDCTNLTCTATNAPLITSTSLYAYFQRCPNFNGAIGNWDTSSVTSMAEILENGNSFNQPIGNWDVSNVTSFGRAFRNMALFNQNIGAWDVSKVTSFSSMFSNATAFNQNIGAWDVSKVTSFSSMFSNATAFNNGGSDDIDNWTFSTTSNINMNGMFNGATAFNRNISSWNTERVTNMSSMFGNNTAFNQNINTKTINSGLPNEYVAWDTSSVTNMASMFNGASAFNQNIGAWDVSNVTNFVGFMANKTAANYSAANLDSIYNGWSSLPSLKPNINISFGSIAYTSPSQAGKDILTNAPNNWVITDGGVAFQYTADVSVAGTSGVGFFQLPLVSDGNTINSIVDWGDGTTSAVTAFNDVDTLHDYNVTTGAAGTKTITISGLFSGWQFNNGGDKLKMRNVASWGALKISVEAGFYGCENMTGTATDVPTITTTSLAYYFENTKFNGELNYWNVSGVSVFLRMFRFASQFNQPLDLWNMSNATNLQAMFAYSLFNQNVNSWNVSNVTNFINTFGFCTFNQPLDLWVLNTSQPIDMTGMFESNTAFNQNIGAWNTISVTNMRYMFDDCPTFNNDGDSSIGAWNTSNVTNMENMFFNATAFNQDIGSWDVSNVANFTNFMTGKTAANYSAQNLASIYNQWSQLTLKPNININFNTIDYCDTAEANKQSIITNFGWTITDGNAVPCP